MRRLLLIRHGETDENAQGRTIGVSDPPLNAVGRDQARALGRRLGDMPIHRVRSSPRLRCRETSEFIGAARCAPLVPDVDERLVEVGLGAIEGLSHAEIKEAGLWDVFLGWRQGIPPQYPDGAESFEQAADRMADVYREIVPAPGETTALIGHSHSMRILIATQILGSSPEAHRRLRLDHARAAVIEWEGSVPRLTSLNA